MRVLYTQDCMPATTDRPTAPPDFDLQEFARESDSKVTVATPVSEIAPADPFLDDLLDPASEVRLSARAPIGQFLSLEAWARELTGLPFVVAPRDVLLSLPLDHRAGFLLSLMDGTLDLETVVEVSAMPRLEVLALVQELHDSGVIEFRSK